MQEDKIVDFEEIAFGLYRIVKSNTIGYTVGKYVDINTIITLANNDEVKVEILPMNEIWVTL